MRLLLAQRVRPAGVLLVLLLVGTGCGVADSVRPSAVGDDQWRLSAVFDDALNLPTGAPVKRGGVVVGKVVAIRPDDYRARVDMAIDDGIELRQGSRFRLRYTTALGELYVDVTPAIRGAALAEGTVVQGPDAITSATVEDTLASASLLVNGGGLGQVQTIVSELNTALDGRVGATKGMLSETDRFLAEALRSTRQIDRVLVALNRASATLDRREDTLNRALRELRPAARVLRENTDDLARLLRRSDQLAVVADRLVDRTRTDLTLVVEELGPVLEELYAARGDLVPGLDVVNRFADLADEAAPTDYLNLVFMLHVDSVLTGKPLVPRGGPAPGDGPPDLPELPGLPGLAGLPGLPERGDVAGALP